MMKGYTNPAFISNPIAAPLLLLLLTPFTTGLPLRRPSQPPQTTPTTTDFIKTSCSTTEYPILCVATLIAYASKIKTNPTELAQTALSVSLDQARRASASMSRLSSSTMGALKPREAVALRDCMETLGDAVEELRSSLSEMDHLRGQNFGFRISDIQTWVSAALTNEDTCMDGFDMGGGGGGGGERVEGGVKSVVRGEVVKVARLTSNALALINGLVSTTSPQ
ncbi:hypothetical protein QJS10_CPA01g02696 [Acorus calamus]|uniref:Pectinesterase inhibitor domain-containing protein n=1 Tax=Acorus calamus TaxID=4465 RepID=A0AAV9FNT9_ACOCL|nr:hypothetical protein QJS10_CPA01g02696 [Acorus calamus]